MLLVIQSTHIGIVPNLSPSQRRASVTFQCNAVNPFAREQVSLCRAPLNIDFREVFFEENVLLFLRRVNVKRHFYYLGFAVGVGRKVQNARAWRAFCEVVFAVAGHACHVKAFDITGSALAVAVNNVVDGAAVVLFKHLQPQNVFAHKYLVGHANHLVFTVAIEDNYIVEVGAVAYKFVLLKAGTDEPVLPVDVQFFVGFGHLCGVDGVETANFGEPRMGCTIGLQQVFVPRNGYIGHVVQVVCNALYFGFDGGHELIGLVLIIFKDALHFYFEQP